jgi:hypothetical protein
MGPHHLRPEEIDTVLAVALAADLEDAMADTLPAPPTDDVGDWRDEHRRDVWDEVDEELRGERERTWQEGST